MLLSGKSFILCRCNTIPYNYLTKNSARFIIVSARKTDSTDASKTKENPIFEFEFPKKILAQSAIAVLGLGFVDAGYSGDWSRIGAISKETEELLKIAAFVVVPFCLLLIFSVSKNSEK